jgi:formylglycine-generating enzyme required for sulfatase activity
MKKAVCAGLLLAASCGLPAGAVPVQATQDKDKILRRFIDDFVPLTPGKNKFAASFRMGSDDGPGEEKPAHNVKFEHAFQMAKYETTQELYEAIAGKNPSRWKGPRNSVEMVSWDEARAFCQTVTKELRTLKFIGAVEVIRLPTEAEWEYACRAGSKTKYSFGDDAAKLGEFAWFTGNAKGNDPPVGAKKANAWGLFDMHGYVWEWCLDGWREDYQKAWNDGHPGKIKDVKKHAIRGGAWTSEADACRCASRRGVAVDNRTPDVGFRCVRTDLDFE